MQNILQVKRHQKTRKCVADRNHQQTDDAKAEATNLEQFEIDERTFCPRLVNEKSRQSRKKDGDEKQLDRAADDLMGAAVEDKHQHSRERAEQDGAKIVERSRRLRRRGP